MTVRTVAVVILIPFALLTAYALMEVGYWGIFDYHRHSPAGWQVIVDLVIALLLVFIWMVPEAKSNGRNPWPWVILTCFTGSIGVLLYLIFARESLVDEGNPTPISNG